MKALGRETRRGQWKRMRKCRKGCIVRFEFLLPRSNCRAVL